MAERVSSTADDTEEQDDDEKEERDFLRNKDLHSETAGVGYRAANGSTSRPVATDATGTFLRKNFYRGAVSVVRTGFKDEVEQVPVSVRCVRGSEIEIPMMMKRKKSHALVWGRTGR